MLHASNTHPLIGGSKHVLSAACECVARLATGSGANRYVGAAFVAIRHRRRGMAAGSRAC